MNVNLTDDERRYLLDMVRDEVDVIGDDRAEGYRVDTTALIEKLS